MLHFFLLEIANRQNKTGGNCGKYYDYRDNDVHDIAKVHLGFITAEWEKGISKYGNKVHYQKNDPSHANGGMDLRKDFNSNLININGINKRNPFLLPLLTNLLIL